MLHNLTVFSVIQPKLPKLIEAGQHADPTAFRTLERKLQIEAGTWILALALGASIALFVLLPVALIARVPLRKFLRATREPALIAFSTTSSEAALPKAMAAMDGRFSVSIDDVRRIAVPVLRHRIATNFQAQAEGMDPETVITRLLDEVPEPKIPKYV